MAAQNPAKTVLAGASDYGIGAWSVGATGAITGAGNVVPKVSEYQFETCLFSENLTVSSDPSTAIQAFSGG